VKKGDLWERETDAMSSWRGTYGGKIDVGEVADVCVFAMDEGSEGASVFDVDGGACGTRKALGMTVSVEPNGLGSRTYGRDRKNRGEGVDARESAVGAGDEYTAILGDGDDRAKGPKALR
jgi:hypothetical protein